MFIVVERGTSGGRVAGHVTASGPLGPAFMFREFKILGILGYVKFNQKFSKDLLL